MNNLNVAWGINSRNELSLIYKDHQSPPFFGDEHVIDITYSAGGMVFVLINKDGSEILEYSTNVFPPQWQSLVLILPGGIRVHKIDAGPDDKTYMVLSDGSVAVVSKPDQGEESLTPEIIDGIEHAMQVSAASDGTVWVIASDPAIGSVVSWLDPKSKKWSTIPDLNNARRVAGTNNGKAYVVDSAGDLWLYDKKGKSKSIPCEHDVSEISIGSDDTLWIVIQDTGINGGLIYTTSNQGKTWEKVDASALYLDAGVLQET